MNLTQDTRDKRDLESLEKCSSFMVVDVDGIVVQLCHECGNQCL
jgi:hypothetical protein